MGYGDVPLLLLAVLATLFAAGIGCIDAALTRVSRVAVEGFVRAGRPRAASLATIVADPGRYLALLLLLRIVGEMVAAACVTVIAVHTYGAGFIAVGFGALVGTLFAYIFVGVVFRTLGRQHAPVIALATAGLTSWLGRMFGPLPRLLIAFGNAVTPGPGYRDGPFATEAELRDLVDLAEENSVIERGERDMIASVFELGDTLVREVMVPRPDMVYIESVKTVAQAISLALRSGFSRIPVIGESVDDVVGIAFLKDMVGREREGWDTRPVSDVMRPPALVPESKHADVLLREMQASRTHMAIVIDEYGGTAGLVTIEDILEEIVGEITDEYDAEIVPVEWIDGDTARVTARLGVDDLRELFGTDELPGSEDVETVGGLLANALGRVPLPGATATVGVVTLTAESAAGRRNQIGTVVVRRLSGQAGDVAAGGSASTPTGDTAGGGPPRGNGPGGSRAAGGSGSEAAYAGSHRADGEQGGGDRTGKNRTDGTGGTGGTGSTFSTDNDVVGAAGGGGGRRQGSDAGATGTVTRRAASGART
ncbi:MULTISPECIES: hemolysin family protein [Frankiaceae]|uniref:CBS domain containing protein n=1 Tax=Candidatus Protofrankia datiscae TaxID=2716812 RepID=F8B4M6_9ACTN|nr:CBS domain containing protein [Candidatus Protofrankia datiscae]